MFENGAIFFHFCITHASCITRQALERSIALFFPYLNVHSPFFKNTLITFVSVIVAPIEIKIQFLPDIDSCLAYALRVASKIHVRRVGIEGKIRMGV